MIPRVHLEYTRIPIHVALKFAEWISKGMWAKYETRKNEFAETDKWYNTTNYKTMTYPLTTNELFIRFIEENLNPEL
ncbi:MAG: hypothetical protein WC917_03560 [Bacilli bacterium]|jgi:hypothetical protein